MKNELPERTPLRLKDFDYSKNGAYFITICTRDRLEILSTIVGDGALDVPRPRLTEIGAIVEKYIISSNNIKDVTIDRYVIMPDHIHMIVILHSSHNGNEAEFDRDGTDASLFRRYAPYEVPSPTEAKQDLLDGTSRAPSPTNAKIPRLVAALKRLCNKEIGENIFQRSYMDHIILNHADYEEHVRYIYDNPKRWRYNHRI